MAYQNQKFREILEWRPEKKFGVIDVYIDFQKLKNLGQVGDGQTTQSNEESGKTVGKISEFLFDSPLEFLPCISLALEKIRTLKLQKTPRKKVCARFYNFRRNIEVLNVRSKYINHFVSIKGKRIALNLSISKV